MILIFNFPEINWDFKHSNNNSYSSTLFLDTIQNLLITQHVDFPTHARSKDTPHILDLVITDGQFVNNIEELAPLGKSNHSVFTHDSIYAIARICHGNSVCPCVCLCLSVCPSHEWISQKRLKLGSRSFHHTVAPSL